MVEPAGSTEERFEILGTLGEGAMGVVYRAYDQRRRHDVALKVLRSISGARLFRFKQEFRALADVVHPNLVTLYELHALDDDWMFSMELIGGVSFLEHVRPHADPRVPAPTAAVRRAALRAAHVAPDRLLSAACQLAQGVHAIHGAGKLHRDLKPSNVLVEPRGRVVICDFGLVTELGGAETTDNDRAWGTPRYMAPEQAEGARLSEASDWYGVGVMLYEALAGAAPFEGSPREVMARKLDGEAPPLIADCDPALASLVMALLARDAERRPGGAEVLHTLESLASAAATTTDQPAAIPSEAPIEISGEIAPAPRPDGARPPFVGRGAELDALRAAYRDSRRHGVTVLIAGAPGLGKTALVRSFLDELTDGDAIVLTGRCYQRETVPHGALDALVDALSGLLVTMPEDAVRALIPREVASLMRLFPVLGRVPALENAFPLFVPTDGQELRARGFGTLRVLLARLAADRPLVLFLDDLQWGDADSGGFLLDLVHHPSAPRLLLIATYRDEDAADSPLVRDLATARGSGDLRRLDLPPLPVEAGIELATRLLGRGADAATRSRRLASEAGGHPMFLTELVRAESEALAGDDSGPGDDASPGAAPTSRLTALLRRRWRRLDAPARRFLAAVALAGRPVATDLVSQATGVTDEAGILASLRAASLVRVHRRAAVDEVEAFHDRIREAIAGALSAPARRAVHRAFAEALEARAEPDASQLLDHWIGAGDDARASAAARAAAAAAEQALAFDRAAQLHALALDLADRAGTLGPEHRSAWTEQRASCLVLAGDLGAAVDAFLAAAEGAAPERVLDLHGRAANAAMRAGDLRRGLALVGPVAEAAGVHLPRSPRRALAAAIVELLRAAVRRRRFTARPEAARDPRLLRQIDIYRWLALGLGFVQPVQGALFHARQVRLSLAAGDPQRAAIALIERIANVSTGGIRTRKRVERMTAEVRALPGFDPDGPVGGYLEGALGLAAFLRGDFAAAADMLARGERSMSDDAGAMRWQIDLARLYRLATCVYRGRFAELTTLVPLFLREADDRGDEFLAIRLRAWRSNVAWLALDQPDEARAGADTLAAYTTGGPFHLHYYFELHAAAQIDVYRGDPASAWRRIEAAWKFLERSLLLRMQFARIEGAFLRGRVALALAAAGGPASLLGDVEIQVNWLRGERVAWADALASFLTALAAVQRGAATAADQLAAAATACETSDMALLAVAARRRRGQLIAGTAGASAVDAADAWMRNESIRAPDRFARLWAP
jgi:eukaryotic-like serine/threonine-protein kinase